MHTPPFFRPEAGWVGDVIPYAEDGRFHLFYLLDRRAENPAGMPWHRVTTDDLVTFIDAGLALPTGTSPDSQDHNCYTGSVVRDDAGVHHLFYTAQNPIDPDGRSPSSSRRPSCSSAAPCCCRFCSRSTSRSSSGTASPICSSSASTTTRTW